MLEKCKKFLSRLNTIYSSVGKISYVYICFENKDKCHVRTTFSAISLQIREGWCVYMSSTLLHELLAMVLD